VNNAGYIGYRDNTSNNVNASLGVIPIALVVKAAITALPYIIPFISNAFKSPAKDSRKIIDALKPQLQGKDARERLGLVIAAGEKISDNAKDVEAKELLLWYRQAYPNDYQTLLIDDKIFFNNYILSIRNTRADGNNMYSNLDQAMFTQSEINYGANPVQTITNLLSNKNNILIYGGIALALILLLKK
jgi:hypothetical protein